MEFLLVLLLLAPLAGLFSGGGDDEPEEGDGPVEQAGNGNDTLSAADDRDHAFLAGGGNDNLTGQGGADALAGQAGSDLIAGGAGGDLLFGGAGDDTLYGQIGDDLVVGGAGNDLVQGGAGEDYLIGGNGSDTLRGFDGDDFLNGLDIDGVSVRTELSIPRPGQIEGIRNGLQGFFGQTMTESQFDLFEQEFLSQRNGAGVVDTGNTGVDVIQGGNGNDILLGNAGDILTGEAGADEFRIVEGAGAPVVISDYDPDSEEIRIYVPQSSTDALSFADVAGRVELRIGAEVVGILNGTTVAELDQTRISVVRFDLSA